MLIVFFAFFVHRQRNVFYDHEPIRSPIPSAGTHSNNNSGSQYPSQPLPRYQRGKFTFKTNGTNFNDTNHATSQDNQFTFNSNSNHQTQHSKYHFYNGLKSYDEICTKRGISCQQLDAQLSKDHHVIVILR